MKTLPAQRVLQNHQSPYASVCRAESANIRLFFGAENVLSRPESRRRPGATPFLKAVLGVCLGWMSGCVSTVPTKPSQPFIPDISHHNPCAQRFLLAGDRHLTQGEIQLAKRVFREKIRPELITINTAQPAPERGVTDAAHQGMRVCFFEAENAADDYSKASTYLLAFYTPVSVPVADAAA